MNRDPLFRARVNVENLLDRFGRQLGLGKLKFDENGVCRLVFDEQFNADIELADDGASFYMYAVVGKIPPDNRESFYLELLSAHLFGTGTGGGTFAVDRSRDEVVFNRSFSQDLTDPDMFAREVERFVNYLELWAGLFREGEVGRKKEPLELPDIHRVSRV